MRFEFVSAHESKSEKSARQIKRGPATIILQDDYELPTVFDEARAEKAARPLALAVEDFDIDGFPDLFAAYADENGVFLTFHKGNAEAFAPTQSETLEGIRQGVFPDGFVADAKVIQLPVAPDFVVSGDFNRDTDPDILVAQRGGSEVYLIAGDGKGNFQTPQAISVGGRITALTAGQIDLMDGRADLVVGIETDEAASLVVYEGAERGVFDAPAVYSLPAPATQLALGELDDSLMRDLAILAGGEVFILHGRNQREAKTTDDATRFERVPLPFAVKSFALGQ